MLVMVIAIVVDALRTVSKVLERGIGIVGNLRKNQNSSIVKFAQNTEKSPGDLLSLRLS